MAQGAQSSAQGWPREVGWGVEWEGGSWGKGCMYTYDWSALLYNRNQHSIVRHYPPIKVKFKNGKAQK